MAARILAPLASELRSTRFLWIGVQPDPGGLERALDHSKFLFGEESVDTLGAMVVSSMEIDRSEGSVDGVVPVATETCSVAGPTIDAGSTVARVDSQ